MTVDAVSSRTAQAPIDNVVRYFGAEHVQKLTDLSRYQLREWDKAGFFAPAYAHENRRVAHGRIYSFTDLVGLRTLSVLSKKHKIGLPELKRVAAKLSKWSATPWSSLTLYVLKKEVHFQHPKTGVIEGAISGQLAVAIPLENVMQDMRKEADKLRKRPSDSVGKVERSRFRMHNAWVIAGTRIPLSSIYNWIDAGFPVSKVLEQYPDLKRADVKAALDFRSQLTQAA